jgi:hypothetical protein
MRFFGIIILIFFSRIISASTQKDSIDYKFIDNLQISTQIGKGLLIAHRSSINSIVNDYPQHLSLEVSKTTFGRKSWHRLYNFPSLGLGYYRGTLGSDRILGNLNALYGFIEAPYYNERNITILYKFGFGSAYISKKYDIDKNIYNSAIGSHINVFVLLSFDAKINLYQRRLFLKTGLGITHASNGKTQTPNLGLNMLDWHFSLSYYLGKRENPLKTNLPKRKKHTFVVIGAGGFKEFTEPNLGKYFAGNTTLEYEYSVMNKSSWGVGIDGFYDGTIKRELELDNDPKPTQHALRLGMHLGFVYNYGKVGFVVQTGSYIAPYYKDEFMFYSRFGLRAKLNKHILANLTLKTHYARADIIEFGLGYYFQK